MAPRLALLVIVLCLPAMPASAQEPDGYCIAFDPAAPQPVMVDPANCEGTPPRVTSTLP